MAVAPSARSHTAVMTTPSGTQELTGLVGWVADVMTALGPVGAGLLVALENLFPPIPSEIVLPFAGFLAARGRMGVWVAIVATTAGSVAGAMVLYEVGRALGLDRARRLLLRLPLMDHGDVARAVAWFERHGVAAVLTGRFLPLVRSVVSLPAGAERMGRGRFVLYTALGSGTWNTAWVWAGYVVGDRWRSIGRYSDLLNAVLAATAAVLVARFVWARRDRLPWTSARDPRH